MLKVYQIVYGPFQIRMDRIEKKLMRKHGELFNMNKIIFYAIYIQKYLRIRIKRAHILEIIIYWKINENKIFFQIKFRM